MSLYCHFFKSVNGSIWILENKFQLIVSLILILIVLDAARRSVGWPLPIVSF